MPEKGEVVLVYMKTEWQNKNNWEKQLPVDIVMAGITEQEEKEK